jgi:hypothetical protein
MMNAFMHHSLCHLPRDYCSEQKSPKGYHFAWLKKGRFHSIVVKWASFTMRFAFRENDEVAVLLAAAIYAERRST